MSWKYRVWRAIAGAYCLACGAGRPRPGLRVLCYHAVETPLPGDRWGLSLPRQSFRRQMELLASGEFGRIIPLGAASSPCAEPQVCVTFDDGYQDALTEVAPVLARLGLPFTVCVTPGLLGSSPAHLTDASLVELSRRPGVEIGAHGLGHRKLTELSDHELDRELSESRRRLEALIGRPVVSMTYPHGRSDLRVRDAAARAGFKVAGCSRYGLNGPGRDRLMLCRTEIVAWDDEESFRQKVLGGWDWFRFRRRDPARDGGGRAFDLPCAK